MRHPVVLSSLEEDFKAIGILDENKDQTESTSGDAEGGKELEEVKKTRTKRHGAAERRKWRMGKKKGKAKAAARKYRRKGSVKRMLKKHRMKASKLRKGKPAGRMRLVFGDEAVANLLEQVQEALSGAEATELDESKVQNAIKSFANLAIIAEMLGDFFTACVEEANEGDDVDDLAEAAEFFTEMSQSAASIASALNEGKTELSFDEIEEAFQEQMEAVVEGLEMYADLTEADDCDDDEDDEGDDDEEEDDDEDMDESVASDSVAARMEAVKADMKKKLGKGE